MKILVDNSDRILGFAMIRNDWIRGGRGYGGGSNSQVTKLPYSSKLRDAVLAHLTMAEGLGPLLGNVTTQ